MALSTFPLPPFVLLGLLLGMGGLLVGLAVRVLARGRAQRAFVRRIGIGACVVPVACLLLGAWTTGPLPPRVVGWLAWPLAPFLLAAGASILLPGVRAEAKPRDG